LSAKDYSQRCEKCGLARIDHTPTSDLANLLLSNGFHLPHQIRLDLPRSMKAVGEQSVTQSRMRECDQCGLVMEMEVVGQQKMSKIMRALVRYPG